MPKCLISLYTTPFIFLGFTYLLGRLFLQKVCLGGCNRTLDQKKMQCCKYFHEESYLLEAQIWVRSVFNKHFDIFHILILLLNWESNSEINYQKCTIYKWWQDHKYTIYFIGNFISNLRTEFSINDIHASISNTSEN